MYSVDTAKYIVTHYITHRFIMAVLIFFRMTRKRIALTILWQDVCTSDPSVHSSVCHTTMCQSRSGIKSNNYP